MRIPAPAAFKARFRPVYHAFLTALRPEGRRITINGSDAIRFIAPLQAFSPNSEPDVWHRLMDAVQPGDACVDVGASIGRYTLGFLNRLRGHGRVFSFEPDFHSYEILQRNIALNDPSGIACALNAAVSDSAGILKFVSGRGPTSHAAGPGEAAPCVSVASLTLDALFLGSGIAPDIVKIDVEGYELQVLKGGARVLGGPKRPRLIYLDVHPWAWPKLGLDTTLDSLRRELDELGYEVEDRNKEFADLFAVPKAAVYST